MQKGGGEEALNEDEGGQFGRGEGGQKGGGEDALKEEE